MDSKFSAIFGSIAIGPSPLAARIPRASVSQIHRMRRDVGFIARVWKSLSSALPGETTHAEATCPPLLVDEVVTRSSKHAWS